MAKSERVSVETETGYVAHLSAAYSVDETVLVKASTVFKGFNTPAIVIKQYEGPSAMARAQEYMSTLKAALLGEGVSK